jgi:hypothetical protein
LILSNANSELMMTSGVVSVSEILISTIKGTN